MNRTATYIDKDNKFNTFPGGKNYWTQKEVIIYEETIICIRTCRDNEMYRVVRSQAIKRFGELRLQEIWWK